MDYSNIIVAALALIGTLVGSYMSHSKTTALISFRLEQLEQKVNLHNNAVERLYMAEKTLELQGEKIRVANHRIDDLEHAKAGE